jgi:hypothetical protein
MSTVVWNACTFDMWIEGINVLNTSLPNLELYVHICNHLPHVLGEQCAESIPNPQKEI